jgi:hypothetical protein
MKKINFRNYPSLIKEDLYLVMVFFLMTIAILSKSFYQSSGYLSPDSTNYLALAQNLLDGNGFYITSLNQSGKEFFAIWPIGYPFLIYLLAKLTGLSVFWASKVLNIFFIGLILGILKSLFNKNAYLYGLIFLFASYIEIFTYTWSETAFIFGLVWFSASIFNFVKKPNELFLISVSLLFSSLFLFLSRYIGAFSFGIIGLLGIYFGLVKKDKSKFIILIAISLFNLLLMSGYLYHNLLETGNITGMPRIPSPETNANLFSTLFKASVSELIIHQNDTYFRKNLIFLAQYALIGFFTFKYRGYVFKPKVQESNNKLILPFIFGIIGVTYLFFIILMRWAAHFDEFSFRLLAPGSFLIFIAIINYIENKTTQQYFKVFKILLLSATLFSWILNAPLKIRDKNELEYIVTVKNTIRQYDKIEKNSIVIFGNNHINYLFTDLKIVRPLSLPYSIKKESWTEFMIRINPDNIRNIYLEVPADLNAENYDISVVELTKKYKPNSLVKLE